MAYGWIITKDHCADKGAPVATLANAVGLVGPCRVSQSDLALLKSGRGEQFRILDDDGELYYEGRIVGEYSGFEPVDDLGTPNAGCSEIQYRRSGQWKTL